MTCIVKIAREMGLYKEFNTNQNSTLLLKDNEDENSSACDPDQPPMFLGDKTSTLLFPKRRKYYSCEESVASLIGSSNLGVLQVRNQASVTDDVTSNEGLNIYSNNEDDENEYCACGNNHCNLSCPSENVVLVQCSNSSKNGRNRNKSTPYSYFQRLRN